MTDAYAKRPYPHYRPSSLSPLSNTSTSNEFSSTIVRSLSNASWCCPRICSSIYRVLPSHRLVDSPEQPPPEPSHLRANYPGPEHDSPFSSFESPLSTPKAHSPAHSFDLPLRSFSFRAYRDLGASRSCSIWLRRPCHSHLAHL